MKHYAWPGNIRELENLLTRAAILTRSDTLTPEVLALPKDDGGTETASEANVQHREPRLISLDELEHEHIEAILHHVRWHKGKACEILGISRPSLERKIDKYGIS